MTQSKPKTEQIKKEAIALRTEILRMLNKAGSGHPGGSLSMVEILLGLFDYALKYDPKNPEWEGRDRLILSKGHGCPALYAILALRGYFPLKELATLRKLGSRLQGHPQRGLPGVEIVSGSLGQGVSVAHGMALGERLNGKDTRIWCICGDGEMQEGQVWETAMSAAHYKLDHFHVIVDANGVQQNGPVKNVMNIEPLAQKWEAFGWKAFEIDGHDIELILGTYEKMMQVKGQPTVLIARTVKGKGVSFMAGNHKWHGVAPNDDELEKALAEVGKGI
ncbi:MAG: transketolase [Candidatus Omnitrophica bacterium]|nr:transketolase [Candidatus Omnitrophota bacterium]